MQKDVTVMNTGQKGVEREWCGYLLKVKKKSTRAVREGRCGCKVEERIQYAG